MKRLLVSADQVTLQSGERLRGSLATRANDSYKYMPRVQKAKKLTSPLNRSRGGRCFNRFTLKGSEN
jgi:hypothetical protein